MADVSPPRPPAFRIGSLRGFLPLSDTSLTPRGQALSSLIQDRSIASLKEVGHQVRSRWSADTESIGSRSFENDAERLTNGKTLGNSPAKSQYARSERRDSLLGRDTNVLNTPQMRSMRLIGKNNPRYQWERYYQPEAQLKTMKKPLRQYYERNNRLITSYVYIDRLLDSSLPHDLIQEYSYPGLEGSAPTSKKSIPEESPAPSSATTQQHPSHDVVPSSGDDGNPTKIRVKRTPQAIYKVPNEHTALLSSGPGVDEGPKALELADDDVDDDANSGSRVVTIAIYINLAANAILLAGKIAVIVLTSSLSVLASLVDAALDFLSTGIVWTTTKLISRQDEYRYPVGRRRLEPLGVLVFSVIMITSFFQVFLECVNRLNSPDHSIVALGLPAIVIMASTVFIKLGCWFWCRLIKNSSVQALAQDAMTDVVFNIFSIIFPLVGYYAKLWWLDALGGLLLSLYVIFNWSSTSKEHIQHLTGAAAPADDRNILLYLTMRFASTIKSIQGCQAYHAGDKLNVEVDVVLDEGMSLRDSHDLGESLQYVLESVPSVDRAFVHLDYADYNLPNHMSQQAE